MTVRSAQLCNASITTAGAFVVVYTCPTGHRAIVKDLRMISGAAAPGLMFFAIHSGAVRTAVAVANPAVTFQVLAERGAFIVMNPGDTIEAYVQSATAAAQLIASGAELET